MQKPQNVSLAVNLQWGSLAIGIINGFADPMGTAQRNPLLAIVIGVITLGLMALLNFKISSGKNWARITFLVLYLLGMVPSLFIFPTIIRASVFAGVVLIFQAVVQAVSLFLVFTKPGSEWFNKDNRLTAFEDARVETLKQ